MRLPPLRFSERRIRDISAGAAALAVALFCNSRPWANAGQEAPLAGEAGPKNLGSEKATQTSGPTETQARELLRRAAEAVIALGKEPNGSQSQTLTEIGQAQAEAGDLEGARVSLRKAAADALAQEKPNAWCVWRVGHFQAVAGAQEDAKATLRRATELAKDQDLRVRMDGRAVETLAAIIQDQARIKDGAGLAVSLETIRERHAEVTDRVNPLCHDEFVGALATAGAVEEAFGTAAFAVRGGATRGRLAADALGKIAEGAQFLDEATAKEVVTRVEEELKALAPALGDGSSAYTELAQAQARQGRIEAARQTALGIAPHVADGAVVSDSRPYALGRVAAIQDEAGDRAGALETMRLALKLIKDNPGIPDAQTRLQTVGCRLATLGDVQGAREAVSRLNPGCKYEALADLSRAQRAMGLRAISRATLAEASADARLAADNPPEVNVARPPAPATHPGNDGAAEARRKAESEAPRRSFALVKLASIRALAGKYQGAADAFAEADRLKGVLGGLAVTAGTDSWTVAQARASTGDLAGAIDFASGIGPADVKRKALSGAASGYRQWKAMQRFAKP